METGNPQTYGMEQESCVSLINENNALYFILKWIEK